ncbi:ABC transporter permease [Clostridium sp. CF012]|uniref:ABC transporter permease n=1 Tax=Clostridium sp. CF012 TaxID=2843319 RepID=UPI001C0D8799|nr:ABC transporter permease [Clostridium sp. CF012]MBU3142728.1 ABC transporter permease [Clostridium sp. CF012]
MSIRNVLIVFRSRFLISMKMYFRYPINFIMTLLDPLMWLTPFYFMGKTFSSNGSISGFERYTGNSDFMGYLVVGYIISAYVSTVFWTMGFSLKEEMREGVLESNWSAPVNRIVLMVSKSLFQFCATTFEVILTGIVCHFAFGFTINSNILQFLAFLIPGIIGMMGLGMAVAAAVLIAKEANGIIDITSSMVSAMSGSYFPIKVMPKFFVFISLSLPLTYIYDSSRAILINQVPLFSLRTEYFIILIGMIIFCIIGSWIFMRVEKKCRSLGILGTH